MSDPKPFSLIKPTLETPYHIDFDWYKEHDGNWRVFLLNCLCPEHQETYKDRSEDGMIDWIDPETAEVKRVDGLQSTLMSHCAKEPGFVTTNTAMVDAIFRVFLSNGNNPMTPVELSDKIGKPADTILKTISGLQVYKGIRPA
ncbi:hypothetical protein SDC9_72025 [bioreactor metagenome]|uniref:Uncharacterized protein n=1 Tax=bioreactor metagenome TaxID=1076179 RepID=A0A644YB50_9ZZZZ